APVFFAGAVTNASTQPEAAIALLRFLSSSEAAPVITKAGLMPLPERKGICGPGRRRHQFCSTLPPAQNLRDLNACARPPGSNRFLSDLDGIPWTRTNSGDGQKTFKRLTGTAAI